VDAQSTAAVGRSGPQSSGMLDGRVSRILPIHGRGFPLLMDPPILEAQDPSIPRGLVANKSKDTSHPKSRSPPLKTPRQRPPAARVSTTAAAAVGRCGPLSASVGQHRHTASLTVRPPSARATPGSEPPPLSRAPFPCAAPEAAHTLPSGAARGGLGGSSPPRGCALRMGLGTASGLMGVCSRLDRVQRRMASWVTCTDVAMSTEFNPCEQ
jgi:hypothetical protein